MRRHLIALLVATAVVLGACDVETAGAPTGDLTLFATFDDVQDLTPGHNVQASNVVVGSVRDVSLDGYRAKVEISVIDDFKVPEGTAAVVRRTSLLGEYYLDLDLPEDFDAAAGPFLTSGDVIENATTQPDVEQLAGQAAAVIGALTADDIGATVSAAAEGLGGRGAVLNQLVRDAGLVAGTLAEQQAAIASTVDSVGQLGATLAPSADQLGATLAQLATATGTLAGSRDRMVGSVGALVELATVTNDTVLEPHAEQLTALLSQLEPLLGTLAARDDVLVDLIVDMSRFTDLFPDVVHNGTVLLQGWINPNIPAIVQGLGNTVEGLLDALLGIVGLGL
jgi:phospholipid/cholesterol/gamma-HCH transport system substrate-binding protein